MPERLHQELNSIRLTLLVAMLFTALAATVFRTPPILFMAALLWSAPLVGLLLSLISNRHLALERSLPLTATVGDVIGGRILVRNCTWWPLFFVHVRSGQLRGKALPSPSGSPRQHSPPEYAWPIVTIGGEEQVVPLLRPGEQLALEQQWLLRRRGVHHLPAARAGALDPLGLFSRLDPKTLSQPVTVLPRHLKIDRLGFQGGRVQGLYAPQHAAAVADATDFHGIRTWRPGEPIRRVHWKSTARTGQLHVVEWEEDIAADVTVLLDSQAATVAGIDVENSFETAITLAATIAVHLLEKGYRFQLFAWQASENHGSAQTIPRQRRWHLPWHSTTEREHHAARMRQIEARNSSGITGIRQLLAELEPVEVDTATLPHLAQQAMSSIPNDRNVILIASTLADIAGAARLLGSTQSGQPRCQALALDAVSFSIDPAAAATISMAPQTSPGGHSLGADAGVRIIHRGDSLVAALERTASARF